MAGTLANDLFLSRLLTCEERNDILKAWTGGKEDMIASLRAILEKNVSANSANFHHFLSKLTSAGQDDVAKSLQNQCMFN